jgi:hypothetical protein
MLLIPAARFDSQFMVKVKGGKVQVLEYVFPGAEKLVAAHPLTVSLQTSPVYFEVSASSCVVPVNPYTIEVLHEQFACLVWGVRFFLSATGTGKLLNRQFPVQPHVRLRHACLHSPIPSTLAPVQLSSHLCFVTPQSLWMKSPPGF